MYYLVLCKCTLCCVHNIYSNPREKRFSTLFPTSKTTKETSTERKKKKEAKKEQPKKPSYRKVSILKLTNYNGKKIIFNFKFHSVDLSQNVDHNLFSQKFFRKIKYFTKMG